MRLVSRCPGRWHAGPPRSGPPTRGPTHPARARRGVGAEDRGPGPAGPRRGRCGHRPRRRPAVLYLVGGAEYQRATTLANGDDPAAALGGASTAESLLSPWPNAATLLANVNLTLFLGGDSARLATAVQWARQAVAAIRRTRTCGCCWPTSSWPGVRLARPRPAPRGHWSSGLGPPGSGRPRGDRRQPERALRGAEVATALARRPPETVPGERPAGRGAGMPGLAPDPPAAVGGLQLPLAVRPQTGVRTDPVELVTADTAPEPLRSAGGDLDPLA